RLELIQQDPLIVIDVGHTPDAIRQALASLKSVHGGENWILVIGVSVDKKASQIVEALASAFDTIICTKAHHKGRKAEDIAEAVREANLQATVHIAACIETAVELSKSLARSQGRKVYVAGGLFLAVEYAVVVRGGRAQDLQFF